MLTREPFKLESPGSPATGERAEPAERAGRATARREEATLRLGDPDAPVRIEFESDRVALMAWAVVGLLLGAVCVWKLGTVAQWLGVGFLVVGLVNLYKTLMRFVHPPGTIEVVGDRVTLPRGYALGKPVTVDRSAVSSTYFLRRSTPWTQTGPVLVVEAGGRAFMYARSWFASEADQRRVLHALLPRS